MRWGSRPWGRGQSVAPPSGWRRAGTTCRSDEGGGRGGDGWSETGKLWGGRQGGKLTEAELRTAGE